MNLIIDQREQVLDQRETCAAESGPESFSFGAAQCE